MHTKARESRKAVGLAVATLVTLVFLLTLPLRRSIAEPTEDTPSGSWFADRRQDARFMALYRQILEHVQQMDAKAEQLRVPDFPAGKEWFNSPPLSLERQLAGKIVILDFWTYCCINCIHVLPDLAALEEQYAGFPVAFVGVHSAKFENERLSENIRQAVLRYEIRHPVINDDDMSLWRQLGVRSWPSLLVVGPRGNALLMVAGEGQKDVLDACIAAALNHYPAEAFRHDPVPITLESEGRVAGEALRFPGKLAIDGEGERLFISDSNHNRVVVTDLEGKHLDTIGSGRIGLVDGSFDDGRFNRPQGLARNARYLYVADAENHALRRVDLDAREVITLAGDGTQGRDYKGGKSGSDQRLSTPWDVLVDGEKVYVAMAGTHQIWVHDTKSSVTEVFSGDGRELNLNHANRLQAAWAQPSGMTIGDGELFVADSESSTVRAIHLKDGSTRTIVGGDSSEPQNLFAFGDRDGQGDEARLQHCLAVLWIESIRRVAVADTYNHRIKLVDPNTNTVETLAGDGDPGFEDGSFAEAQFSEPSGLALSPDGKSLYVADANNHAIRVLDLERKRVDTLQIRGVPGPQSAFAPRSQRLADLPGTVRREVGPLRVSAGAPGSLRLIPQLPGGFHYAEGAPSRWQLLADVDSPVIIEEERASGAIAADSEILIPFVASTAETTGTLRLEALAYFCRDGGSCEVGSVLFEIAVEVRSGESSGAESSPLTLEHTFTSAAASFRTLLEPAAE